MKLHKPTSKIFAVCLMSTVISLAVGIISPSDAAINDQEKPSNKGELRIYVDGFQLQSSISLNYLKSKWSEGKLTFTLKEGSGQPKANASLIVVRKGLAVKSLNKKDITPGEAIMAAEIFNFLRSGDHLVVNIDWETSRLIESILISK